MKISIERQRLGGMERLSALAKPYAQENPKITIGEVLQRELAKFPAPPPITPSDGTVRMAIAGLSRAEFVEHPALIVGALAVHACRSLKTRGRRENAVCEVVNSYTVTHCRTGRSIVSGIPNQDDALRVAALLNQFDWNFDGIWMPADTREKAWIVAAAAQLGVFPEAHDNRIL